MNLRSVWLILMSLFNESLHGWLMLTLFNALTPVWWCSPQAQVTKQGHSVTQPIWECQVSSRQDNNNNNQKCGLYMLHLMFLFSSFCNFLSPPSEWRLMCCLVLFRSSNQSRLLSPGEGLYTGQFVTTILLNLGSHRWLRRTLYMHGWSLLQGPHWHTYWESIASLPRNKDQMLEQHPTSSVALHVFLGLIMTFYFHSWWFHLYTVEGPPPLIWVNVETMYLMYHIMFSFPVSLAIHCTSQWGKQLDASTPLSWFPLQNLRPAGLPLLQGSVWHQTRWLPGKTAACLRPSSP